MPVAHDFRNLALPPMRGTAARNKGRALGRRLFIPYGVADSSITFCPVDIDELPSELV